MAQNLFDTAMFVAFSLNIVWCELIKINIVLKFEIAFVNWIQLYLQSFPVFHVDTVLVIILS